MALLLLLRLGGHRLILAIVAAVVTGLLMYALVTTGEAATGLQLAPDGSSQADTAPARTRPRPPSSRPPAAKPQAKPTDAAARWYAARHKLPARNVRPLQADKITANKVRVLLLVTRAGGRLDSVLVTARRSKDGWVGADR
jgi:hypothetical protein